MINPRLVIEFSELKNLEDSSGGLIKVEPIEVQPGWPPQRYVVTYLCNGIAKINESSEPIFSSFHQVEIYLSKQYPLKEPKLRWITDIWHPNIEHEEPKHVCTNNVQTYHATKSLTELVLAMGEMVQYKRYFAEWAPPYPLDKDAAAWVRDYAEPKEIVSPTKPIDSRPLRRPTYISIKSVQLNKPRIKFGQQVKLENK